MNTRLGRLDLLPQSTLLLFLSMSSLTTKSTMTTGTAAVFKVPPTALSHLSSSAELPTDVNQMATSFCTTAAPTPASASIRAMRRGSADLCSAGAAGKSSVLSATGSTRLVATVTHAETGRTCEVSRPMLIPTPPSHVTALDRTRSFKLTTPRPTTTTYAVYGEDTYVRSWLARPGLVTASSRRGFGIGSVQSV